MSLRDTCIGRHVACCALIIGLLTGCATSNVEKQNETVLRGGENVKGATRVVGAGKVIGEAAKAAMRAWRRWRLRAKRPSEPPGGPETDEKQQKPDRNSPTDSRRSKSKHSLAG